MVTFHKLRLAADMFFEAHSLYLSAKRDMDYVTSILLSGAVLGIVMPVLKEQGTEYEHKSLARFASDLAGLSDEDSDSSCIVKDERFRQTYNAIKHAGDHRPKRFLKASEDMEIEIELRQEAAQLLDAAKSDFSKINVSDEIREMLKPEFLDLLKICGSYIDVPQLD